LKTAALARPAAPLAACVQRHPGTETNKMWLPWRRPLPAVQNSAKIGPVDFEIIGLTGIVRNKKQKQKTHSPQARFQQQGG